MLKGSALPALWSRLPWALVSCLDLAGASSWSPCLHLDWTSQSPFCSQSELAKKIQIIPYPYSKTFKRSLYMQTRSKSPYTQSLPVPLISSTTLPSLIKLVFCHSSNTSASFAFQGLCTCGSPAWHTVPLMDELPAHFRPHQRGHSTSPSLYYPGPVPITLSCCIFLPCT